MKATIIRNGRIIDPANNRDEIADLLIVDGRIADDRRAATSASPARTNPKLSRSMPLI